MTYTHPFVLHTAQGYFSANGVTPLEQWVVTLKFGSVAGTLGDVANLPAFLATAAPLWQTFHNNAAVASGTACYLTGVTAAVVGQDGLYVGGGVQTTTELAITPDAGVGADMLPFATACVYTLRTAAFRGHASRGRFYYPATGLKVASDGLWATGATRAAAAKTLLDGLNAAVNPELAAGCSLSVMSKLGGGTTRNVTAVAVGRIPDRQERREGHLSEDYSASTLA